MLWAALAYAAGIIAGTHFSCPSWWCIAATAAILAAALYLLTQRKLLASFLALAAFCFAGALQIQLQNHSAVRDSSLIPFAYGPPVEITGHVTRESRSRPASPAELSQSLDLQTEEIVTENGARVPVHSGVRLTIYQDIDNSRPNSPGQLTLRRFHYGERIHLSAKLKLPRNFHNPGAFDYETYLAENGIAALASTRAEDVDLIPGFAGNRFELWRTKIHSSIITKIHTLWPPPQAALLDAMVIGESAFIDRDTRVDFQRSGTYHVLVVSGMNVTILAFVIFWTLRRLRLAEIPATLLTIIFCVAYALLTEVGAPVWRATLMCAIFLGTRLLYRDRCMVNALGAAALGLLAFDPRQLFAASFQMTFLCVLIVAAIGLPLIERTSRLYRRALAHWDADDYGATLPPRVAQFRVDLRLIAGRLANFIGSTWSLRLVRGVTIFSLRAFELLLVSAVMQMGLALPMAYYFHRATTIGLPANIAVVPLTQLLMPTAVLTVALGYISLALAKFPALLTAACTTGNYWHRARLGQPALGRSSRSHAVVHDDCCSFRGFGRGNGSRPPSSVTCGSRPHSPLGGIPDPCLLAAQPANALGNFRGYFHRCRRRRFHSAGHAARPHSAHRRWRPGLGRRHATRLRRRRRRALSLDAPHLPPRRRRHFPRPLRPHRRYARHPERFPPERIVGWPASAQPCPG